MIFDIYTEHIIRHATNPHNYGELEGVVGVRADNLVCGDELVLYINQDKGCVSQISFTAVSCALCTASASLFTDHLISKNVSELKSMTPGDVYTLFAVPVTPARSNCVLLVYRALENWLIQEDTKNLRA